MLPRRSFLLGTAAAIAAPALPPLPTYEGYLSRLITEYGEREVMRMGLLRIEGAASIPVERWRAIFAGIDDRWTVMPTGALSLDVGPLVPIPAGLYRATFAPRPDAVA